MTGADELSRALLRAERLLVACSAGVVGIAAAIGRSELAREGVVSPRTWALADASLALLVERMLVLESASPGDSARRWRAGQ